MGRRNNARRWDHDTQSFRDTSKTRKARGRARAKRYKKRQDGRGEQ